MDCRRMASGGLRGRTESVPLFVGLGKAAELARKNLPNYEAGVRQLRDALEPEILETIPNPELNGHETRRPGNTTNITFRGVESEALLLLLDQEGICASSGSACRADSDEPSHVVKAMKPDSTSSREVICFSLGADNTMDEVKAAVSSLQKSVHALGE